MTVAHTLSPTAKSGSTSGGTKSKGLQYKYLLHLPHSSQATSRSRSGESYSYISPLLTKQFVNVIQYFKTLNIASDIYLSIIEILICILHLGNLEIRPKTVFQDTNESKKSDRKSFFGRSASSNITASENELEGEIAPSPHLDAVRMILGVEDIETWLSCKHSRISGAETASPSSKFGLRKTNSTVISNLMSDKSSIGSDVAHMPLSVECIVRQIQLLSTSLYERTWLYLISLCNQSLRLDYISGERKCEDFLSFYTRSSSNIKMEEIDSNIDLKSIYLLDCTGKDDKNHLCSAVHELDTFCMNYINEKVFCLYLKHIISPASFDKDEVTSPITSTITSTPVIPSCKYNSYSYEDFKNTVKSAFSENQSVLQFYENETSLFRLIESYCLLHMSKDDFLYSKAYINGLSTQINNQYFNKNSCYYNNTNKKFRDILVMNQSGSSMSSQSHLSSKVLTDNIQFSFAIKHYGYPVIYDSSQFLLDSVDGLNDELMQRLQRKNRPNEEGEHTMGGCSFVLGQLVSVAYGTMGNNSASSSTGSSSSNRSHVQLAKKGVNSLLSRNISGSAVNARCVSRGSLFRANISPVFHSIVETNIQYVLCIKPFRDTVDTALSPPKSMSSMSSLRSSIGKMPHSQQSTYDNNCVHEQLCQYNVYDIICNNISGYVLKYSYVQIYQEFLENGILKLLRINSDVNMYSKNTSSNQETWSGDSRDSKDGIGVSRVDESDRNGNLVIEVEEEDVIRIVNHILSLPKISNYYQMETNGFPMNDVTIECKYNIMEEIIKLIQNEKALLIQKNYRINCCLPKKLHQIHKNVEILKTLVVKYKYYLKRKLKFRLFQLKLKSYSYLMYLWRLKARVHRRKEVKLIVLLLNRHHWKKRIQVYLLKGYTVKGVMCMHYYRMRFQNMRRGVMVVQRVFRGYKSRIDSKDFITNQRIVMHQRLLRRSIRVIYR